MPEQFAENHPVLDPKELSAQYGGMAQLATELKDRITDWRIDHMIRKIGYLRNEAIMQDAINYEAGRMGILWFSRDSEDPDTALRATLALREAHTKQGPHMFSFTSTPDSFEMSSREFGQHIPRLRTAEEIRSFPNGFRALRVATYLLSRRDPDNLEGI